MGVISWIILIAALGVFCYAGYQLFTIFSAYHEADSEYDEIRTSYTSSVDPEPSSDEEAPEAEDGTETLSPPIEIDWEQLQGVNADIVGWIYVEAEPEISYPICLGSDNEYYLHNTFEKTYNFAGSIFLDYHNSSDFSDPVSILYGHNMKNGSMFGRLKRLKSQEEYDSAQNFWILTPEADYCYHIYAAFDTAVDSATYTLFSGAGDIVKEWEESIYSQSVIGTEEEFSAEDHSVILSTCTSSDSYRCVVIGKRIAELTHES
ncbi:MAG: class B sortase [Eubacteriales bacterium]|nr:class B sortase [Eubacteriales bacterium]